MLHMYGLQAEMFAEHQAAYLQQFAAQQRLANSLTTTTAAARVANGVVQIGLWLERCGRRYINMKRTGKQFPSRDALIEELQLSR